MRKRPSRNELESSFIDNAVTNKSDNETIKEDFHQYIKKSRWPVLEEDIAPSLAEGSKLRKPLTLALKEIEWNSIDRHTKTLGVAKLEWIRYAIFKLMQEEQIYFMKNHKEK